MIIIDFNQTLISSLMANINSNPNEEINENLIRHMVLSTLLSYKKKFGEKYGELVLAADDMNYWRRDVFKHYKANRKKRRSESDFDWNLIFTCLNKIRDEIREVFPYKVIQVPRAEADDIIATLCKESQCEFPWEEPEQIMIVSGDKDFIQLQKYPNVSQYSPIQRKQLRHKDPLAYLKEHIMRGDSGDGVPNFLSPDDVFVSEDAGKQKSIMSKKLTVWMEQEPEEFCDEQMLKNYKRNQMMVDLDYIPEYIVEEIKTQYYAKNTVDRSKLFNYFVQNRLKYLMPSIGDF